MGDKEIRPEYQSLQSLIVALEASDHADKDILVRTFVDEGGRRWILPLSLVYGVDASGGLHRLINSSGNVPVDIAAESSSPNVLTSTVPTPAAGNGSITLGNLGELFVLESVIYIEAGAATPTITVFVAAAAADGGVVVVASSETQLLSAPITITGDAAITCSGGQAGDTFAVRARRIK